MAEVEPTFGGAGAGAGAGAAGAGAGAGEASEGATFLTEPVFNYDDLVDDEQSGLEILISGVTETSQSTLLLKKKKEMREVDDALEFMKEEYRKRMELCAQREKKFQEKQAEMKRMVVRFQQFIQDNDSKRTRADLKAQAEAQARAKLEKDARAREVLLHQLRSQQTDLESRLEKLARYRDYLESIVQPSDGEYLEIDDLLNRHKTLEEANADLHEQAATNKRAIETLHQEIASLRREKMNESLMLSSESQQCVKRIEELSAEAAGLEVASEQSDTMVLDKKREAGRIVNCIQNLYNRCRLSMRSQPKLLVPADKTRAMDLAYLTGCLELVGQRTLNLIDIVDQYPAWQERQAREAAKAKAVREAAKVAGKDDGSGRRGSAYEREPAAGAGGRRDVRAGTSMSSSSGFGSRSVASSFGRSPSSARVAD